MSSEAQVVSDQIQDAPDGAPVAVPANKSMSIIVAKGSLDSANPK